MTERWRAIPGYEGHYEVSDHGNVRSIDRVVHYADETIRLLVGKPLKPVKRDRYGHLMVGLSLNSRAAVRQVHDLVLTVFVEPRPVGMECRHLDGNAGNNRLENLAWGTSRENKQDIIRHGTHHHACRTHCANGHEYTPENTFLREEGGRRCRICKNARERRYYHQRKTA